MTGTGERAHAPRRRSSVYGFRPAPHRPLPVPAPAGKVSAGGSFGWTVGGGDPAFGSARRGWLGQGEKGGRLRPAAGVEAQTGEVKPRFKDVAALEEAEAAAEFEALSEEIADHDVRYYLVRTSLSLCLLV